MTARFGSPALLWAAALCAILALLLAAGGPRTHRRARRLLDGRASTTARPRLEEMRRRVAAALEQLARTSRTEPHERRPPGGTGTSSPGPVTSQPWPARRGMREAAVPRGLAEVRTKAAREAAGPDRTPSRRWKGEPDRPHGVAAGHIAPRPDRGTGSGRKRRADVLGREPGRTPAPGGGERNATEESRFGGRWWRAGPRRWGDRRVELGCGLGGALVGMSTGSVLPVVGGLAAVPVLRRALRRRAEQVAAEQGAAAVSALCGTVAGDLRAGRPPHTALADAVEAAAWAATPELAPGAAVLTSAARFGGDVPQALRSAARSHEGLRGLAAMAACWQVAVDGGAGLAAALDRVAAALRAEAEQREDLRAQLAGPRATAVLLALLPVFGLVLGSGLGADPAAVLLHTPAGLTCLAAGAALEWAGLAWTARIIRTAEGRRPAAVSTASTASARPERRPV